MRPSASILTVGLALLVSAVGFLYAQTERAPLAMAEIEGIVRKFIEENPQVIQDALDRHQYNLQLQVATNTVQGHNPTLGPADAPITIVEFSEFQCPFCARAQPTLDTLRKRYEGRIQFVYKHLPLRFHPEAEPAAKAAQAAHLQGKFWEYSNILWQRQELLGPKLYTEIAKEIGLDLEKFAADRDSAAVAQAITDDLADAQRVGASGTPYFLINGQALSGAQPLETFVDVIESALLQAQYRR